MLPNFLIIGTNKSGTTSLYHYLNSHPDIYMSPLKEPHFFSFEGENLKLRGPDNTFARINDYAITDFEEYKKLFSEVQNEQRVGEASTMYLYYKKSAERIKKYIPDAKLICILRNPVERAFSNYLHAKTDGDEPADSFREALDLETERIKSGWGPLWHYKQVGFYSEQIKKYLRLFSEKQMHFIIFDEYKKDRDRILDEVFDFLGVNPNVDIEDELVYNKSGFNKSSIKQKLYKYHRRRDSISRRLFELIPESFESYLKEKILIPFYNKGLRKPEIADEDYDYLINLYREDITQTANLIDKDLSCWLND